MIIILTTGWFMNNIYGTLRTIRTKLVVEYHTDVVYCAGMDLFYKNLYLLKVTLLVILKIALSD